MAALSTVSVRPSSLMDPAASARSGYPECVLLDKTARVSADRNATTASCRTLDGQRVAVSFWLADPPEVSHFSVHCPGIEEDPPPFIISAAGAFVLFCVTLDGTDHHFVYSARGIPSGKKKKKPKPSLHLLPEPNPTVDAFASQQFGLLPLGDEHYAVAFLDHQWEFHDNAWVYHAYVFSSKTKAWRTSPEPALLHLSESDRPLFDRQASSKQITVGASSLGWVDLLRGIVLLSNLFDDDEPPVITYIPLPAAKVCITDKHGNPHYAPESFCDVVCCDDLIRFVEVEFEDSGFRTNGKAWKATLWNRKVSWDDWRKDLTIDVAEISVDPTSYSAALLPGLLDGKKQKLELKNLYYLNPTLSVHDDDLLYMLAKVDEGDDMGFVVAFDMKHAALQALVPVSTKESGAVTMYSPCAFPKYYINSITSDMGSPVEKDKPDKLQQGRPNSDDAEGHLQQKKRRKKKKQERVVGRRVQQPFLLCFVGCVLIAIIVKLFCHLS